MVTYGTRINPGNIRRKKQPTMPAALKSLLELPLYLAAVIVLPVAWLSTVIKKRRPAKNCFIASRGRPPGNERLAAADSPPEPAALPGWQDREADHAQIAACRLPAPPAESFSKNACGRLRELHELAAPRLKIAAEICAKNAAVAARVGADLSAKGAAAGWQGARIAAGASWRGSRTAAVKAGAATLLVLAFYRYCGNRFRDFISIFTDVAENVWEELADDVRASFNGDAADSADGAAADGSGADSDPDVTVASRAQEPPLEEEFDASAQPESKTRGEDWF